MNEHLIFFDNDCALCHRAVTHLLKIDSERHLLFAPLEGETANEILVGPNAHLSKINSLVLVEHFETDRRMFWIRSQAVFRIYWLLGRKWIGWMCFLPSWFCDFAYRTIAKHRHRLKFGWERPEFKNDRFLP